VEQAGVTTVQLHGDEPPSFAGNLTTPLFRSVTLDDAPSVVEEWPTETTWLLDASDRARRGGTGTAVDWTVAAALARERRVILAGGLTADNVEEAIAIVRPYGVDVSSGVELTPGVKDLEQVSRFIAHARQAFEREHIHR
jgi:phosphoribosylanthranilate isomerase